MKFQNYYYYEDFDDYDYSRESTVEGGFMGDASVIFKNLLLKNYRIWMKLFLNFVVKFFWISSLKLCNQEGFRGLKTSGKIFQKVQPYYKFCLTSHE